MSDPLNKSGDLVHAPVTYSSDVSRTQDLSQKGTKPDQSTSTAEAFPQKGLRVRAKNLLPRSLYQFLVSLISSNSKAQYELGRAISQARKDSSDAWQELGQYHAIPLSEQESKRMYELQLDCRKKDLQLDFLQGWGDSPVAAEKWKVIKLLEQCIAFPDDKKVTKEYETACAVLRKVEYNQDALRRRRAKLKNEARSLTPHSAAAQEHGSLIAEQGKTVFRRLKSIKKELASIEVDIRRYDNSLVDNERAQEAVFYYEKTSKAHEKGDR